MVTKEEYKKIASKYDISTHSYKNIPKAFVFGGMICVVGELLFTLYSNFTEEEAARTWVSVTLIFLASFLTALGVFDKIAKHAGAGTVVPITGFSNAVTAAAMEFKSEGIVLGLGTKIFTIAGPVIVFGTVASVVYGIIYWITTLF
ncbi:MAG: stage V sporulation protein AC [Clostridia bacterium]|nr:stage V sporulation protein AC [Clostridia bacterium]